MFRFWKEYFTPHKPESRAFYVIAKPNCDYIYPEDFNPILNELLETHPGLIFLKETSEFQSKYACII